MGRQGGRRRREQGVGDVPRRQGDRRGGVGTHPIGGGGGGGGGRSRGRGGGTFGDPSRVDDDDCGEDRGRGGRLRRDRRRRVVLRPPRRRQTHRRRGGHPRTPRGRRLLHDRAHPQVARPLEAFDRDILPPRLGPVGRLRPHQRPLRDGRGRSRHQNIRPRQGVRGERRRATDHPYRAHKSREGIGVLGKAPLPLLGGGGQAREVLGPRDESGHTALPRSPQRRLRSGASPHAGPAGDGWQGRGGEGLGHEDEAPGALPHGARQHRRRDTHQGHGSAGEFSSEWSTAGGGVEGAADHIFIFCRLIHRMSRSTRFQLFVYFSHRDPLPPLPPPPPPFR